MRRLSFAVPVAIVTVALAFAACGGNHGTTTSTGSGGTRGSGGSGGAGTSGNLFDASAGSGGSTGAGGDAGKTSYLIYASTDTTLFSLDPTDPTLPLKQIGTYDCIGPSGTPGQQSTAMTDLAVDRNQNIWGLSSFAVRPLTVQGTSVHCGQEIYVHVNDPNQTNPNFPPFIQFEALTFAPVGVLDPSVEVLVAGDTAGQLWAVEPNSSIVQHGQFGTVPASDGHGHTYPYPGGLWELSGDIVFLADSGKPVGFATVRDCPSPPDNTGCDPIDTLIEIDMTALAQAGTQNVTKAIRGQVVKAAGCGDSATGYGSMYGIASWNGSVFGFSRSGNLVQISNVDGTACLVKDYPADLFSGAAVTTVAPVLPPPIN
jgi:hypothetical protein